MTDRPASNDEIRIPTDPEARARLYNFAGLTDEERHAMDVWCFIEQQKRNRGVLLYEGEESVRGRVSDVRSASTTSRGDTVSSEPNCSVEECACCGGPIYTCLLCGFETPSSLTMDDHECETAAGE